MFDVSFNKSSSNAFICGIIGGANVLDGKPNLSFDVFFVNLEKMCFPTHSLCDPFDFFDRTPSVLVFRWNTNVLQ